ncbi:MAG: glycosyltransferase [Gemmatimonadaceae bacterium]
MKTLLYLSPYSVVPPQYGGPARIYNLCRELSREYRVMHFAQQVHRRNARVSVAPVIQHVTPTYTEYSSRNPLSMVLQRAGSRLRWPVVWQSAVLGLSSPRWLREQVERASVITVEHPWQFRWVHEKVGGTKPVVLTAQNVESVLWATGGIRAPSRVAHLLARTVERVERFAVRHATRVFTMSPEDTSELVRRYGVAPERCVVIPNGVACDTLVPATAARRQERKRELGLSGKRVIVFIGSTHGPNRGAVQQIIEWAEGWPDERDHFLIVGGVGRLFPNVRHPRLTITGLVDDSRSFLEAADVAINPIQSGSGTSIKQAEYMALGLPSVATPTGARGITMVDGEHGFVRELGEFPPLLRWLGDHPEVCDRVGAAARAFARLELDWPMIAERAGAVYREIEAASHLQDSPRGATP